MRKRDREKKEVQNPPSYMLEGVEGNFEAIKRRKTRDLLKRDKNFSKQLLEGKFRKKEKSF